VTFWRETLFGPNADGLSLFEATVCLPRNAVSSCGPAATQGKKLPGNDACLNSTPALDTARTVFYQHVLTRDWHTLTLMRAQTAR
jgi:hypothetical protein